MAINKGKLRTNVAAGDADHAALHSDTNAALIAAIDVAEGAASAVSALDQVAAKKVNGLLSVNDLPEATDAELNALVAALRPKLDAIYALAGSTGTGGGGGGSTGTTNDGGSDLAVDPADSTNLTRTNNNFAATTDSLYKARFALKFAAGAEGWYEFTVSQVSGAIILKKDKTTPAGYGFQTDFGLYRQFGSLHPIVNGSEVTNNASNIAAGIFRLRVGLKNGVHSVLFEASTDNRATWQEINSAPSGGVDLHLCLFGENLAATINNLRQKGAVTS